MTDRLFKPPAGLGLCFRIGVAGEMADWRYKQRVRQPSAADAPWKGGTDPGGKPARWVMTGCESFPYFTGY